MKIDPSKLAQNPYLKQIQDPTGKPQSVVEPNQVKAPEGDSVEVSAASQELERLQAEIGELPDARAERIAALREQLARGEYQIDSRAIADRMLEQAVNLEAQEKPGESDDA